MKYDVEEKNEKKGIAEMKTMVWMGPHFKVTHWTMICMFLFKDVLQKYVLQCNCNTLNISSDNYTLDENVLNRQTDRMTYRMTDKERMELSNI